MRKLQFAGLLAIASMGFAASASATTISGTTGGAAATPTLHVASEGHIVLLNPIAKIECGLTAEGKIESHGPGVAVKGDISKLEFPGCTNSWHVTTEKAGFLEAHYTSGHNGILVSSGLLVKTTRFGIVSCNYETNNTTLGTVTGGEPATLHVAASVPLAAGSSGLCGSGSTELEGSVAFTSAGFIAP